MESVLDLTEPMWIPDRKLFLDKLKQSVVKELERMGTFDMMEDTRQKLVVSENKVRQLESQLSQEQRVAKEKVQELEHETSRLSEELENEKAAREEAWAKVSAFELEISAAMRDLEYEKRRVKVARKRIMLRETQLRAFYSTMEEISSSFAEQQEQFKSLQKTLEDEEDDDEEEDDHDDDEEDDGDGETQGNNPLNNENKASEAVDEEDDDDEEVTQQDSG